MKLKTNLDTGLLKLVAMVTMVFDHVGIVLFPDVLLFRAIGRLSFPLFCYCMTVGMLYTRNIRRYMLRILAFAAVSQPLYYFIINDSGQLNPMFALLLGLLVISACQTRSWALMIVALLVADLVPMSYQALGAVYMLVFYLCRNHPFVELMLFTATNVIYYVGPQYAGMLGTFDIGGICVHVSVLAVFAAVLIFSRTNSGIKIPKYLGYVFYPGHILVLGALKYLFF